MATSRSRKKPATKSGGKTTKQTTTTMSEGQTGAMPATKKTPRSKRAKSHKLPATKSSGTIALVLPDGCGTLNVSAQEAGGLMRYALQNLRWKQATKTSGGPTAATKSRSGKSRSGKSRSRAATKGAHGKKTTATPSTVTTTAVATPS